nr:virulence-associated E family protein [Bacillus wiedmannii]
MPEGVNVWENIEGFTNFAIAMYSTHNHTKENPRYRVIIPLHHDIEPEHYKEVTRYLVDILQVWIDETSCEFERHMHYPTCSNPDNYEFYYQDFPFFDASFITKQHEEIKTFKNNEKADPRTKQNWIGAWTNIYSITDVLDNFLSDKYEPFRNNRYTYVEGSSKGGLIVYDDGTHAHSNHSTDPISGKNVNSFDLYRLHKFFHLDNGTEDMKDKPSYKAMIEYCKKDEKVRAYYKEHISGGQGIHKQEEPKVQNEIDFEAVSNFAVELGELDSTMKFEQAALKAFFTENVDEFRRPYQRLSVKYPRMTVFFATVNDDEFLKDKTGNRRYAVINVGDKISDLKATDIDQFWGEVATMALKDDSHLLTSEEAQKQKEHNEESELQTHEEIEILSGFSWGASKDLWTWKSSKVIFKELELTKNTKNAATALKKYGAVRKQKGKDRERGWITPPFAGKPSC